MNLPPPLFESHLLTLMLEQIIEGGLNINLTGGQLKIDCQKEIYIN